MAAAFEPSWLKIADVKAWLRLQDQDTSDDDLLSNVAAMTEPYVQRCRPEWWSNPTAPTVDLPNVPISAQTSQAPGTPVGLVGDYIVANPFRPRPANGQTLSYTWVAADGETASDFIGAGMKIDVGGGGTLQVPVQLSGSGLDVAAAGSWVQGYSIVRLTFLTAPSPRFTWDGVAVPGNRYAPDSESYQGAVMYAAREYRRRNSPAGIEMFGDVTSFVSRFDPDIDRALQTGSYARPVVS